MTPNKNETIIEPDFSGEVMKIPTAMQTPEKSPAPSLINGPILILLFAILLALLGGIYYWYTIVMNTPIVPAQVRPTPAMNNEPESTTAEARTSNTDVVSTSDEIDAISADAESTKFDDFDTVFNAIESELSEALEVTETAQP